METGYRSEIASSTAESITVRGFDLCNDLIGKVQFTDMLFILLQRRLPTGGESAVLNACLVALTEHGVTPSVLAARLTYLGAPEAIQAAMAAGLAGLGSVFVGTIGDTARMLHEGLEEAKLSGTDRAMGIVIRHRNAKSRIPGLGHPIHTNADPRTVRLEAIARGHLEAIPHFDLLRMVAKAHEEVHGRPLVINGAGAIGALLADLGFDPGIVRGFGVVARSAGLLGHLAEEAAHPIAQQIWLRTEAALTHPTDEQRAR